MTDHAKVGEGAQTLVWSEKKRENKMEDLKDMQFGAEKR